MARQVEKYLDTLLAGKHAATADHLRQPRPVLLPTGMLHAGTYRRLLGRRLEGCGFSSIIDDLRNEMAFRYINRGRPSAKRRFEVLGFAALSAFSRWFRRATAVAFESGGRAKGLSDAVSPGEPSMPNLDAWSPRVLSVLRIITALLFMEHGLMKLFHFPAPQPAPGPPADHPDGGGLDRVVAAA
jgi:hypothetical protein